MNVPLRSLSVCAAGACLVGALQAQGENTPAAGESAPMAVPLVPVARKLASLQRLLSARSSLSLISTESGHVEPGFGRDDTPDFTATFQLFYKGDRFLYRVEFLGNKGTIYHREESFDGIRYAAFDRKGGVYTKCARPFMFDVVMCRGHAIFFPFLFLQSEFAKDAYAQVSYEQLTKKDDWQNALASLPTTTRVEEVTLEGQSYVKISQAGKGVDPSSGEPALFDVYFAKDFNWYPMKWDRRVENGELVASYVVEKLDFLKLENGEEIPYPKVAVTKHYVGGKLRDTERIEVKQISFNTVNDADVVIDPSDAQYIQDLDTDGKFKPVK